MTNTLMQIFLPIVIAYILVKLKYINETISKDLILFVVRIAAPSMVFISLYNTDLETLKQLIPIASSYVILTAILILISFLLLFKIKDNRLKAVYIIAIVWGNYGWMGWAVLDGAFGPEGFSRGIFFTTLWWPVLYLGAFFVAKLTKVDSHLDIHNYVINITVPTVALILGVVFNVSGIELYEPLVNTLNKFGSMTVTIILFSVGLSLSFKASFKDIKKAILPVVLRPTLGLLGGYMTLMILGIIDPISRSSILTESAMPVAIFTVVIADMLGLDSKLMSSILIISTLLSIITIPLTLLFV